MMRRILTLLAAGAFSSSLCLAQAQALAAPPDNDDRQAQLFGQCIKIHPEVSGADDLAKPDSPPHQAAPVPHYDTIFRRMVVQQCYDLVWAITDTQAMQLHDKLAALTTQLRQIQADYARSEAAGYAPDEMLQPLRDRFKQHVLAALVLLGKHSGAATEAQLSDTITGYGFKLIGSQASLEVAVDMLREKNPGWFADRHIDDVLAPVLSAFHQVVEPGDYLDPVLKVYTEAGAEMWSQVDDGATAGIDYDRLWDETVRRFLEGSSRLH
jgi:hypothetical protein